ncbi:hypothetical protein N7541_001007 [Penicillium brevicompactum]|uniref:U6 snRNA phosphodiesterase n=1 Tax=Penicillium brevicompactum TaxID=5074 RepID=A0A9W9RVD6_PENBR|nr:hypothetical protein N7541_001007 [Penicillium brevicompactum]
MSLVQYSDSESESESRSSPPAKRPRHDPQPSLPPLPAAFHDLYASTTRVSVQDDPSLHGGRKRVIPHVEGNWPTHLYLEWYPAKEELSLLTNLITQIDKSSADSLHDVHSLLHSDLGAQLPLHISLSRPVVLRTEQRASFTEKLQNSIRQSHVSPFKVRPNTLYWASNYEKTRWFLVFSVQKPPQDHLNRLLRLSNNTLSQFGQPPLYAGSRAQGDENPVSPSTHSDKEQSGDFSGCFHISLAWTLKEPSSKSRDQVAGIDLQGVKDLQIGFDSVKAKIGNNVTNIELDRSLT